MQERLVEDWLTKINERGFEVPFCQSLLGDGHEILFAGHSPIENGKDVISRKNGRELHAYQLKSGDVDLMQFEKHYPQITALVEAEISHPNVTLGSIHSPHFVTTGEISQPVLKRVEDLNKSWKRRGFEPLEMINGRMLQARFLEMSQDFWPANPPEVRAFLGMYLASGKSDLDRPGLAKFLFQLFSPSNPKEPKTNSVRMIAAANLFASYVLREFYANADHWSVFSAWTIVAAHIAWFAENRKLSERDWHGSFQLAVEAAEAALKSLNAEVLKPTSLSPNGYDLDEYVRARNTVAGSAVAIWNLLMKKRGQNLDDRRPVDRVLKLVADGRLLLWGESAVPHFLSIVWFLESFTASPLSDVLLLTLLRLIAARNGEESTCALADPYVMADEALEEHFTKQFSADAVEPSQKAPASYALEVTAILAAKRLFRQHLAAAWSSVTRVNLASFHPTRTEDFLLWQCKEGEEKHLWAGRTQSWAALKAQAALDETRSLPSVFQKHPEFALMFFLVYSHRIGTPLVKFLDQWLK